MYFFIFLRTVCVLLFCTFPKSRPRSSRSFCYRSRMLPDRCGKPFSPVKTSIMTYRCAYMRVLYVCMCIYVCTVNFLSERMYVCMYVCIEDLQYQISLPSISPTCMYVSMYVIHACMYVCMYICIYDLFERIIVTISDINNLSYSVLCRL